VILCRSGKNHAYSWSDAASRVGMDSSSQTPSNLVTDGETLGKKVNNRLLHVFLRPRKLYPPGWPTEDISFIVPGGLDFSSEWASAILDPHSSAPFCLPHNSN
jgi:hypothetical protein